MIARDVLRRRLNVEDANVVVLGLAVTGRATALALAAAGARVLVSEAKTDAPVGAVRELEDAGIEIETGGHERAIARLSDADFVVPSPGISPESRPLAAAIEGRVHIASELDLAQRLTDGLVVGVTGTNGKTTVCRLTERIAREAGFDAYACGNTEVPFIEAVVHHPEAKLFVVECSSFRLAFAETFHPRVAVFTNFAPDHLDWHRDLDDYLSAKLRIAARQDENDLYLYPAAQPELGGVTGPRRVPFAANRPEGEIGAWLEDDDIVVALGRGTKVRAHGVNHLRSRGAQFAEDAAAAAAAAVFVGVEADAIERALRGFSPDAHRLEFVGELDGVSFYNDSMATNPHAAVTAIRSFERVVLIAGGRKKVPDLSPLAGQAHRIVAVVTIGEAADDVEVAFRGTGVPVERGGRMSEAVHIAAAKAIRGDVVLLAPACASQDAYINYAERGQDFVQACRSLGVRM